METVGEIGEKLVQQWLIQKNWCILEHRWRCHFGEIDLIALPESYSLAFIEVKTRSSKNWDEDGLLSINRQKQFKLIKVASYFIAKHSMYSEYNCRFDVALVNYQKNSSILKHCNKNGLVWQDYYFQIQNYLENAFN